MKQMKLWNMTLKDLKPWYKKGENIYLANYRNVHDTIKLL